MKKLLLFAFCLMLLVTTQAQTGHFFPSDRFSSSLISHICQDRSGFVWIATDYGLNKFDGYHFNTYLHDEADSTSLGVNVVVTLLCDRDGNLWVGTNRGLDRFVAERNGFVHYPFPENIHPRVSSICQRRDGTLLIGTAGYGAFTLSSPNGQLQQLPTEGVDPYFSRVYEDARGRVWKSGFSERVTLIDGKKVTHFRSLVGGINDILECDGRLLVLGQHGLMAYHNGEMVRANVDMGDLAQTDVVLTTMAVNDEGQLYIGTRGKGVYRVSRTPHLRLERVEINAYGIDASTAKINDIMFDRRGNLWLGCHRKGVVMMPLHPLQFGNWSFSAQGINVGSTISSVSGGDDGVVWCTIQGVGIYGFDSEGHVVAHPKSPEAVEFIFRDRLSRYWVGTDDGLYTYNPQTGQSQLKVTFDCDRFNDMTSDEQGNIYISAFSRGFCVYNPQTGDLHNYNMNDTDSVNGTLCNNWIMGMSSDAQGNIWMATSSGVSCFDPHTGSFRSQGWQTQLDGVVCFDVCELHRGQLPDGRSLNGIILIGTEQGLYLYDRQKREVQRFPGSEQLNNKMVCYIVQSNDGDLWCSTSAGIWQYQMSSRTFVGHVGGNGLTQKEYLFGVGMHTDDDMVYFGHNDGFTVFSPKRIKESRPSLDSLQLTAFIVGNQSVNAETELNGVRVTEQGVIDSESFTLSYLDHTVSLAFSQLNFDNPENVTFEYRINGGEWIRNIEGKNDFTLSHLDPGTYRVEVRAQVGTEYTPVKEVKVTVRAPWYRSWLAYLLYFAVLAYLVYYSLATYRRRANQQLNEEKMKFLINATHDIRSPLTLIMSPLHNLKRHLDPSLVDANRDVDTIERNAQRILNLVNQILDVRKIDKQQMHLHCQQTDLVAFVRGIYKMYEYNAQERNIEFLFDSDAEQINAWIDRNQFDKVVSNLLSNAFKYSHDLGGVKIALTHTDTHVQLQVIDRGSGLDNDSLRHVFDRFYQGGNSRRLHIDGTGIGLNLCKMIVDMHHGTIEAQNRTDGQTGAVFTVTLPLGNAHLTSEEIENEAEPVKTQVTGPKSPSAKNRVLIVDDDMEIGNYISTELSHFYKFGICHNGKDGLKELLTNDYDVVVSDVMMPEMDGFTMLRMIKTNLNISDIPVVMLTSKADVANRLEGLERGADAFLAKPFDMEELHMVIDNLIHNRQRLKGKYSGAQQQADKVEAPEVKGNDELLMERIMKAINKNLSDSDFNVDMLTQEVGISRAQLHRKMKELTGISTSEFIRNIRLEQAARLLKEQKINVTQVAYTVGFSNLAHFSTIFRKHFGVSPSEYAEREG